MTFNRLNSLGLHFLHTFNMVRKRNTSQSTENIPKPVLKNWRFTTFGLIFAVATVLTGWAGSIP